MINDKAYSEYDKNHKPLLMSCDWIGTIGHSSYKPVLVEDCLTDVHGYNFAEVVNDLHEWLADNEWAVKEYPKAKFQIEQICGMDKHGDIIRKLVYSIPASKAKRLIRFNVSL